MIDGIASPPFSAETLSPIPKPEESNKEKIIRASRERYGTPRVKVEDKISRWIDVVKIAETAPSSPQTLYDAQCSRCGKRTKVVFPPDGKRPVYCKSCRAKIEKEKTGPKIESKEKEPTPALSLQEVLKKEPTSFSSFRKEQKTTPNAQRKRKKVDLEELKKTLGEALKQREDESSKE